MQEIQVESLGWEDPLEEEMATHSSVLAWKISRIRGPWQATVQRVAVGWTGLSSSSSIVFIMCTHHRLFSQFPLCGYYLGFFQYFAVKMMLQWITLWKYIFIFLGGIYLQDTFLQVRLLGWRVNVYVVFVRCCLITLHKHYAIWIRTSHVWESLFPPLTLNTFYWVFF